jgi:RHS repeat-associated protein
VTPTQLAGAEFVGASLATTTPTPHLIEARFAREIGGAVRVLMLAGGGSTAQPNTMRANEIIVEGRKFKRFELDYGYDAQGSMIERKVFHEATVLSTETFSVDYMNRIESYIRDAGGTTEAHHAYLFTPAGQRICNSDRLAARSEWYMSDGDDVVADYSASGTSFSRTASYVQSLSIDSKLARLDAAGGSPIYYIPDALGSVGVTIDAAGTVTDARLTNAWGEDLRPPGPDRYGFTQRERMPEIAILGGTPAHHYRARTYFAELGRFGQKDPLNPPARHFVYAENMPTMLDDPSGLRWDWITDEFHKIKSVRWTPVGNEPADPSDEHYMSAYRFYARARRPDLDEIVRALRKHWIEERRSILADWTAGNFGDPQLDNVQLSKRFNVMIGEEAMDLERGGQTAAVGFETVSRQFVETPAVIRDAAVLALEQEGGSTPLWSLTAEETAYRLATGETPESISADYTLEGGKQFLMMVVAHSRGGPTPGSRPLLERNPRAGTGRVNTELPGGRPTARSIFRNQSKGQNVTTHQLGNGGVRMRADDGTQIRMNPDGSTRVDLPDRGPLGTETIHFP